MEIENDDILCPGDDWIRFQDSKCFKLVRTYVNGSAADDFCALQPNGSASAAKIKTAAEQEFFIQYLYNVSELTSSVWIGMRRGKKVISLCTERILEKVEFYNQNL